MNKSGLLLTILMIEIGLLTLLSGSAIYRSLEKTPEEKENEQIYALIEELHQANIEGNTPSEANFHAFLNRDLNTYFQKNYKGSHTTYELLKNEATQVGVGYPHFYVWVKVFHGNSIITQGAIRLNAMDKTDFYVTHFVSTSQIMSNPKIIESILPPSTWDKAWHKAGF